MVSMFQIDRIVLHSIKKSIRGESVEPELSEAEPSLELQTKAFLQEQVRKALGYGRSVVEEPGLSVVPDVVRRYAQGEDSLLVASRELAVLLQNSQPPQSPEGLLMVADARLDGTRALLVAKLEHERGAQAQQTSEKGHLVFGMKFLDDLFFTTGSRVYKIGCFWLPSDRNAGDKLGGLVVDRQVQAHHVARYFRETYLGCVWTDNPEVMTEKFYEASQGWIDTQVDPEKRARYQVALISDMQSQAQELSVNRFASKHLDASDRDDFVGHMESRSIPMRELPKSTDFVKTHIANVRIDTESGIAVLAPPRRMKDGTVTVEDQHDGTTLLQIRDRVAKTSGYGRYKEQ